MKCFHHPNDDAVATCPRCTRGLCPACAERFLPMMCEPCLVTNNGAVARRMYFRLVLTGMLFSGGAIVGVTQEATVPNSLIAGAVLVSIYWGSIVVGEQASDDFLRVTSPIAWLISRLVILVVGTTIGAIAAPFMIGKSIVEIVRIRRTARNHLHAAPTAALAD